MSAEAPERTSTALSRELGEELRRVRRGSGMGSSDLAEHLEWSIGKLSKLETGTRGTGDREIATLLGACGADRATRDRLFGLMSSDRRAFVRVHQPTNDSLVTVQLHERTAMAFRCFEPFTVPAVLQCEAYARALLHAEVGFGDAHDEVARARLERLDALLTGTECSFYVDERALSVNVGGPAVMHEQMLWLHGLSRLPNVVLRVVPTFDGLPVMTSRAVQVLVPGPADPVVCVELDGVTAVIDNPAVTGTYLRRFEVLASIALEPDESRAHIVQRAAEWMRVIVQDM